MKYPESATENLIRTLQSLVSAFDQKPEADQEAFCGPLIHARIALKDIAQWEFVSIEEIDSKI
jgi:hypothetical protein